MRGKPRTIEEAVREVLSWKWAQDASNIALVRGMAEEDLIGLHFSLGMAIRSELGLWDETSPLREACGASDADGTSSVILRTVWSHLVATATPEEMAEAARATRARKEEQERVDRERWEKAYEGVTERRCPQCGVLCPEYRKTCRCCGFAIGREEEPR